MAECNRLLDLPDSVMNTKINNLAEGVSWLGLGERSRLDGNQGI
jgi:hypothetical protein